MGANVKLETVYKSSENVVAREVQGEFIIIPITSGIGDSEDEIFSLNETGRAIWNKLDGERSLKELVTELSREFESSASKIEKDVVGLLEVLLKKRMVIAL